MSIEESFDRAAIRQDPVTEDNRLSLLSVSEPRERPIQVASIAGDLSAIVAAASLGCDPLYEVQKPLANLTRTLRSETNPGNPAVGALLGDIIGRGVGPMEMRVERLNDYLSGRAGDGRTGFTASLRDNRLVLTHDKSGSSASYSVVEKNDKIYLNPRPVSQHYYRSR
jgi:hypothetical protein